MSRRLGHLFRIKLQKLPDFARKHEKSSIWPKCSTFWSRLPCFDVSVNFSAKSCKKCLASRERMKNRRFGQNVKPSRANHHVSVFGSTFQQKVAKSAHFARNHEKSSIWPKCASFSSKPRYFGVWVNFSAKSCKKCLTSRESIRNHRFGQNVQLFRANNHVSAFASSFQQEVAKSAYFCKKSMENPRFGKNVQLF